MTPRTLQNCAVYFVFFSISSSPPPSPFPLYHSSYSISHSISSFSFQPPYTLFPHPLSLPHIFSLLFSFSFYPTFSIIPSCISSLLLSPSPLHPSLYSLLHSLLFRLALSFFPSSFSFSSLYSFSTSCVSVHRSPKYLIFLILPPSSSPIPFSPSSPSSASYNPLFFFLLLVPFLVLFPSYPYALLIYCLHSPQITPLRIKPFFLSFASSSITSILIQNLDDFDAKKIENKKK